MWVLVIPSTGFDCCYNSYEQAVAVAGSFPHCERFIWCNGRIVAHFGIGNIRF